MSLPYDDYTRDLRDEWNDAYQDRLAEQRAEIQEAKVDAWWERWGCDECRGKGRVPCACNFVDNGFDGCDEYDGNSYVECEPCEGKGHFHRPRRPSLPSDID